MNYTRYFISIACLLISVQWAAGQSNNAAHIYNDIRKLNVLGSVLYVAAHPDDENTRLLAYLAKDRLFRTGYLSLTRGDGGQNLIGDEQGIDLGLIRTQELLAARRIDGAEQFFSRAYDFGFSKSTAEALEKWDENKILADAVWVIRKFQPDIIITRFPEDQRAGHGQHSASAVIAHKAFLAAGDSTKFPNQFKYGVKPWKARRLFWNTYNFGGNNTTSNDQLQVDAGGYDPVIGYSYGEIAALSRSQHKSQGFGVAATRGSSKEFFLQVEGDPASKDILEGIGLGWNRIGHDRIKKDIDDILKKYSVANPAASLPSLLQLHDRISALSDHYWKQQKLKELQQVIEKVSGIWMEAFTRSEYAIQGDSLQVEVVLNNRLGINVSIEAVGIESFDTTIQKKLEQNENFQFTHRLYISDTQAVSQPYWLKEKMSEGSFVVTDQELIGKPWNDPDFHAVFSVSIDGRKFRFRKALRYKYTDPVRGELYQPLVVVPSASVSVDPSILVFRKGNEETRDLLVNVHANRKFEGYKADVSTRVGSSQFSVNDSIFNMDAGTERDYVFTIPTKAIKDREQSQLLAFAQLQNGSALQPAYLSLTSIRYDHIPNIHYFYPDALKTLYIDLKTAGKRVGYIEGAGDRVHIALQQMGYDVVILKEKDITISTLSEFDAVVTGIRAFNVNPFLIQRYQTLMDYVRQGGNLVVQYNTNSFFGAINTDIGPYPFRISRGRVTDENSPVRFALPNHKVLNFPNKISLGDFEGWVQERGIYFADQMAPEYKAPLLLNDPDEQANPGSLIIADYGKGKFVYTGLVFFRQLPAGVPGAYRLMANIIALNQKDAN